MRNVCAIKGKTVKQFFSDDPDRLEHFAQTWNRHNSIFTIALAS